MKKVLLCVMIIALSVSATFGGATEDLFTLVKDENSTPKMIQTLIKFGADVNAKGNDGMTALMWAAHGNKNPEIIKTLLIAGADINANNGGLTALMMAILGNNTLEVIKTLLNAGANVDARDRSNRTALMWEVCFACDIQIIKIDSRICLQRETAKLKRKDENYERIRETGSGGENMSHHRDKGKGYRQGRRCKHLRTRSRGFLRC